MQRACAGFPFVVTAAVTLAQASSSAPLTPRGVNASMAWQWMITRIGDMLFDDVIPAVRMFNPVLTNNSVVWNVYASYGSGMLSAGSSYEVRAAVLWSVPGFQNTSLSQSTVMTCPPQLVPGRVAVSPMAGIAGLTR